LPPPPPYLELPALKGETGSKKNTGTAAEPR
jgi:hypothetical protein